MFKSAMSSNPTLLNFGQFFSLGASCLEMDKHFERQSQVFLHSFCYDTWEILENGNLLNIGDELCIGRDSNSDAAAVDCGSKDVVTFFASMVG